ncbi:hypothetical protein C1645_830729 [Glomus cerebriforme]|uniref:Uncharacterized protein n=1 Tax=Glomus cerebriforme TaxID=658196 RepID=A0A397SH40_9GLOM|nr:hypothetical protein C1645_830729 [Glomus cerebriforme]
MSNTTNTDNTKMDFKQTLATPTTSTIPANTSASSISATSSTSTTSTTTKFKLSAELQKVYDLRRSLITAVNKEAKLAYLPDIVDVCVLLTYVIQYKQ